MNTYLILLLIIILYVYISYYYRYPTDTKIINANSDSFNSQLLYEKHPIVLLDNHKLLSDIKQNYFYLSSSSSIVIPEQQWNKNNFKYLFIQPLTDTEIYLLPAFKNLSPDETIITLQMTPSQVLILPFHWKYSIASSVNALGIHDLISWILP